MARPERYSCVRYSALSTPRISLVASETPVCGCPACRTGGRWVGTGRVLYRVLLLPGLYRLGTTLPQPVYPLIGIARAQPVPEPRVHASTRALQALPGPSAHPGSSRGQMALLQPKGRDFIIYILKLVKTWECHHFSSMRPGMLPVSKTGLKVMTLNSWISINR